MNLFGYMLAASGGLPPFVELTNILQTDSEVDPTDATCGFQFLTDGTWSDTGGAAQDSGTWLLRGVVADYEIRLTKSAGSDPSSGNLNTWESLSSIRAWSWTQGSVGAKTFDGTIEIRRAVNSLVVGSASASITCTVS